MLYKGIAESTRSKYQNKLKYFLKYCEEIKLDPLLVDETSLFWYIVWRRNYDETCTDGVVKSEIIAIESLLTDNMRHLSVLSWKPIQRLLNGFKKECPSKSNTKQPISEKSFVKMLDMIPDSCHDLQLLRAALCWEQNGFQRSSGYTVKSNKNLTIEKLVDSVSLW